MDDLSEDEVGMLYWLREFPDRKVQVDATISSLIAKGLLNRDDGFITVSAAGMLWPDVSPRDQAMRAGPLRQSPAGG